MAVSVSKKALGIGLTDAAALLFIFAVPALSHLSALPFYLMDPMRVAVLGALLVSRNWKNGLALAVALPLFSFAVSGHPVFPKCLLIAAELSVNVLLFVWLSRAFCRFSAGRGASALDRASSVPSSGRAAVGAATFLSILLSKALYYGLKALVLSAGLMQMELVSTALMVQFAVALLISLGFALWWKK